MSIEPQSPKTPVIEMRGVAMSPPHNRGARSLKNVEWSVAAGDYWVVAGLQGSGKTDFLMVTGGLIPPADGSYRLFGELMPIIEPERLETRLRLGLVFDDGRLFSQLTVAENVGLALQYHRNLSADGLRATVAEFLEATEMSSWANNTPAGMAWSWQKRAALARALALRPEVLLLDNPLTGLDARHCNWWLNFLGQLSAGCALMNGRPMTLVVTTGTLSPWKKRGKRFAQIKNGEFVVLGSQEDLNRTTDSLATEFLSNAGNI